MTLRRAMRRRTAWATAGALTLAVAAPAQEPPRPVPYWASIAAGDALMRTGPGANYPAMWRYRRADLPVRVIQVHESWRRVADPDGVVGWMAAALLARRRTAIVTGEVRALHAGPVEDAKVVWRVEPGVTGRVSRCSGGWCLFETGGKSGYLRTGDVWGVGAGEVVE